MRNKTAIFLAVIFFRISVKINGNTEVIDEHTEV